MEDVYYDSLYDHLCRYGGSNSQADAPNKANDEIIKLDSLPRDTPEALAAFNDRVNYIIEILDAINQSI